MKLLFVGNIHLDGLLQHLKQRIEREGYHVEVATSNGNGHAENLNGAYDAVFRFDLDFPRQASGQLLWKEERASGKARQGPSFTLTTQLRIQTSFKPGCWSVVSLPNDQNRLQEVLARLPELIQQGLQQKDLILHIGELEINLTARSVQREGQAIPLTRREFELLELLARHRGRVVSSTMIWEHLYRELNEAPSNIVAVYIRYLRNKIDRKFGKPMILTFWGRGYMLRDEA
jgi:DNA-binding response OmpR family regulator